MAAMTAGDDPQIGLAIRQDRLQIDGVSLRIEQFEIGWRMRPQGHLGRGQRQGRVAHRDPDLARPVRRDVRRLGQQLLARQGRAVGALGVLIGTGLAAGRPKRHPRRELGRGPGRRAVPDQSLDYKLGSSNTPQTTQTSKNQC
jgi:hypothetical protein